MGSQKRLPSENRTSRNLGPSLVAQNGCNSGFFTLSSGSSVVGLGWCLTLELKEKATPSTNLVFDHRSGVNIRDFKIQAHLGGVMCISIM